MSTLIIYALGTFPSRRRFTLFPETVPEPLSFALCTKRRMIVQIHCSQTLLGYYEFATIMTYFDSV